MAINENHQKDSFNVTSDTLIISANGSLILPRGNGSERPSSHYPGMIRFNTSSNNVEIFSSSWNTLKKGGNPVKILNIENSLNIQISSISYNENFSYEISLNNNILISGNYTKFFVNEKGIITSAFQASISDYEPPLSDINLNGYKIIFLEDPINLNDAATKNYVDNTTNIILSSLGSGAEIGLGSSAKKEIFFRSITEGGLIKINEEINNIKLSASKSLIETSSLGGIPFGLVVSSNNITNTAELQIRGLSTNDNSIEISSLQNYLLLSSNSFFHIQNSSLGNGINPIVYVSGGEIISRSILGANIIEVSSKPDNTIILSANTINLSLSTISLGSNIIGQVSSKEIIQRTIQGKGNIDVRLSSNGSVILSSFDTNFIDNNFKLLFQRNFFTSPGTLSITGSLSAYNEIYVTMFNVFPSANAPLAFRIRINGSLITTSSYNYNIISMNNGVITYGGTIDGGRSLCIISGGLEQGDATKRRRSLSGYIRFFTPNNLNINSAVSSWFSEVRYMNPSGNEIFFSTMGSNTVSRNAITKMDGLSIFIDHSNTTIAGGLIKIYGRS